MINNLETGGVQVSLLNLIKEIHNIYDVTVLSFVCRDEYRALLPENVKLIGVTSPFMYLGISQNELQGHTLHFFIRSFWAVLIRIFGRSKTIRLMSLFQKKIGTYDCAISYLHESPQRSVYGGCNEFLLKKVVAKKKIAWLHCDFEHCGSNNVQSRKIYERFDKIVACSEGCRQAFVKCLPNLAEKTVSIRNCNDFDKIRELAADGVTYDKNYFNIVTVARLSQEKGIERAIDVIKNCIDKGYKVKYHIIGSGDQEASLKDMVSALGLEEIIVFYGSQKNPYQFMKNADLFLLPSYHEAAPMVFDEAACLGIPVLAMETTSTYEMLEVCSHGIVCKNDVTSMENSLVAIVSHPETVKKIKKNLKNKNFTNNVSIQQITEIIEEGKGML